MKTIGKINDRINTIGLPKLNKKEYLDPEATGSNFPCAKSFEDLKDSFKKSDYTVVHLAPKKITDNTVGGSRKGDLGIEDTGLYVAPKGHGNPYFIRKNLPSTSMKDIYDNLKKGISIGVSNTLEKWKIELAYISSPRLYESKVKGVVEPPKQVLEQPGFKAVNEWGQKNLVGTGYIRYTKRSMLGFGKVKRQNYYNPIENKITKEMGTKEYEAIVDKGYKLNIHPSKGYIEWDGRRILVHDVSLVVDKSLNGTENINHINNEFMSLGYDINNLKSSKLYNYDEFKNILLKSEKTYYTNNEVNIMNYSSSFNNLININYNKNYNNDNISNINNNLDSKNRDNEKRNNEYEGHNYEKNKNYGSDYVKNNSNRNKYYNGSNKKYYSDEGRVKYNKNNYENGSRDSKNNYKHNSYNYSDSYPNNYPNLKPSDYPKPYSKNEPYLDKYPKPSPDKYPKPNPNISSPIINSMPHVPSIPRPYFPRNPQPSKNKNKKRDKDKELFPKVIKPLYVKPPSVKKNKRKWELRDLLNPGKMFKDVDDSIKNINKNIKI